MTVQQQRALDSLYALDNVLTIKIVPAHTTFANVGVKKKSFCGSLDSEKPCLHLDFGRFGEANVTAAEDVIGSRYLTLNNSIRDRSYVRQPLGYRCSAWPAYRIHGATTRECSSTARSSATDSVASTVSAST